MKNSNVTFADVIGLADELPHVRNERHSRRFFLSGLVAGAGSLALAACGGAASATGASGSGIADATAKAAAKAAASANGTTIPPATQIVDSGGAVWTLSGHIASQGARVRSTVVALVLLYNGRIYVQNTDGTWWLSHNDTASTNVATPNWTGVASDPRGTSSAAAASPSGTTVPAATQIVDSGGAVWTLAGNVASQGTSVRSNVVAQILFYSGRVYVQNTDGTWWLSNNDAAVTNVATPSWTSIASDPRGTANASPSSIFYAVNGHIAQGGAYNTASMAQQVAYLSQLGAKLYRNDTWDQGTATLLKSLAQAAAPSGIQLCACMTPDTSVVSSETQAYSVGYAQGQMTANTLKGLVKYYECGNEYENNIVQDDGVAPSQYNNTAFPIYRGLIRGMIDGVKSVDSGNQVIPAPGSWLHFGFFDMLWNGTQPDGSSGYPPVRWDITSWHWYSDMGDITAATGGSGTYNMLNELQTRYGKPIWISEYGVRPNFGTDAQIASYLVGNSMLAGFAANAARYGVQCTIMYELFDDGQAGGDGNYGLIQFDAVTKKPSFSALQSFITANPR